jgi:hypothetical protein
MLPGFGSPDTTAGGVPSAAMRTRSSSLKILVGLDRDHRNLHAFEQGLALGQTHAESLNRHFLALHRQHLSSTLAPGVNSVPFGAVAVSLY